MSIRFRIEPRDVPADRAARRLGLSPGDFDARLPDLIARGFPPADPTTGHFDLKAIDAWMDRRSGLAGAINPAAVTDPATVSARIARMGRG